MSEASSIETEKEELLPAEGKWKRRNDAKIKNYKKSKRAAKTSLKGTKEEWEILRR